MQVLPVYLSFDVPILHIGFAEYFLIGMVAVIFIVDAILLARGGDPATISDRFAIWAMRYPIVAALVGILLGHLCWPNRGYC